MGLLALPSDVQRVIYSHLKQEDLLRLNATCRLTRTLVSPRIRAISQPIFEKRYGAIAACEKEIPIYILAQRTAQILDLPVQLDIEQPFQELLDKLHGMSRREKLLLVLHDDSKLKQKTFKIAQSIVAQMTSHPSTVQFDQKEVPHLKPRETYLPGHNLSFWQRLTTKYHFFRTLLNETYTIRNVYKTKLEALKELNEQPFVNIQNFIDRRRRISNLEREITTLTFLVLSKDADYNEFCKKLSYFEAIAFRICYYVGSRMLPFSTEINFNSFFTIAELCEKKTIKFTETTLTFKNKPLPIEIRLDLSISKPGIITFSFLKNNKMCGFFTINRVWKDGNNRDYTEASDANVPIVGQLTQRRLHIEFRSVNKKEKLLKQDPSTGDFPLLRLMTQFCVEIFQRESEKKLEIIPLFPHVALAGGFYLTGFNVHALLAETVEARAQGKLFPVYQKIHQQMGYPFYCPNQMPPQPYKICAARHSTACYGRFYPQRPTHNMGSLYSTKSAYPWIRPNSPSSHHARPIYF
jgi:hypothetical protein